MQVNGWELFAHPLLLDQLEKLNAAVEKARAKQPMTYQSSANFKVLAAVQRLMFEAIPADPTRPEFRQGGTLGEHRQHWFRAKFGGQRFRLFFRWDSRARVIIYAWVNDSDSLRTYGSKSDAYAVFRKMLDKGNPPEDWAALLKTAKDPSTGEEKGMFVSSAGATGEASTAGTGSTAGRSRSLRSAASGIVARNRSST